MAGRTVLSQQSRLVQFVDELAKPRPGVESFAETQRRRMRHTNLLAIGITLAVCTAEIASQGYGALWHLVAALPFLAFFAFTHRLVSGTGYIEPISRIWMAIGCLGLWFDVAVSGGINGHAAPMLFLLPVGAALILRLRDTAIVGIANPVVIGMLACLEMWALIPGTPSSESPATTAIVVGIASLCVSVTVMILMKHNLRIQKVLHEALENTRYMAEYDQLTGLRNRQWASAKLTSIVDAQLGHHLMLIDLDGFKQVNDVHGHGAGDQLLRVVASRLLKEADARESVVRLGGDEFMILSPCHEMGDCRAELADRVIRALGEPVHLDDREIKISCSMGVARFPDHADTGVELMARADQALYAAKSSGKNRVCVFQEEMEASSRREKRVLSQLKKALPAGELRLHYQPQYDLATGQLIGFEALARWTDNELGKISPDEFIRVAEKYGMIVELGEYLLRRACQEAKHWLNFHNPQDDLRLSVNVSAVQLDRGDLVNGVQAILDETGFPPNRLELEITETVLIQDTEKAIAILNALASLGVGIALDDFGTGYASLSYLRQLNLNRLKIDRSFVGRLNHPRGQAFVRAIVQLADALDLTVVAEGVETDAQRQILKEMKCGAAQGFFYAPSIPPEQLLSVMVGVQNRTAAMTEGNATRGAT